MLLTTPSFRNKDTYNYVNHLNISMDKSHTLLHLKALEMPLVDPGGTYHYHCTPKKL